MIKSNSKLRAPGIFETHYGNVSPQTLAAAHTLQNMPVDMTNMQAAPPRPGWSFDWTPTPTVNQHHNIKCSTCGRYAPATGCVPCTAKMVKCAKEAAEKREAESNAKRAATIDRLLVGTVYLLTGVAAGMLIMYLLGGR